MPTVSKAAKQFDAQEIPQLGTICYWQKLRSEGLSSSEYGNDRIVRG